MSHRLADLTRGDTSPVYTFTITRTSPALDLTTATTVKLFGRVRGQTSNLFTKSVGSGVTVSSASVCTVTLSASDTSSLTGDGPWTLDLELEVVESGGRVTTAWTGNMRVRADLG